MCAGVRMHSALYNYFLAEGSLEVKLPTIWTDGKAEVGRVREEKRREERRSEKRKSQKKEDAGARKSQKKSRNTAFFNWFVAPEGRKVGSLKRRVRRHLGRWEMKNCTLLWREAHFEVKTYKTDQQRNTFWKLWCGKVHAAVARSACGRKKCKKLTVSDYFWKLRWWKSARRCGAKHISKSKSTKHISFGALLEVEMRKKCTPLWCEAHFEVRMLKAHVRATFGHWSVVLCGRRKGFCTMLKVSKTWVSVRHLKKICKDAFCVAGAVQETCSSEMLGGPGADFLRGVAFWSIRSSGLLRWFCFVWPGLTFSWQVQYFRDMEWKNRKTHWHLHSIIEGSLAELVRFWCCQLRKLRKSRRIPLFLTLSSSKIEEVSQYCCVFDVVKFKNEVSQNSFVFKLADRQVDRYIGRQKDG